MTSAHYSKKLTVDDDALEITIKSPLPPFSKGESLLEDLKPLFGKACPELFDCAQDKLRRREG
jgi:hypothetical protein